MAFNGTQAGTGAVYGAGMGSSFGLPGMLVGGALGGLLGGFGSSTKNPADVAMPYLNQMNQPLHQYYDPYVQQGQRLSPQLEQQYMAMMQDPNAIIARMGAGYQRSPGYDWQLKQGEQAMSNQMAAGGMLGSPQAQQYAGEMAQGLASKDYNDYLDHVMKMFGLGTEGAQGLQTQGYQASSSLADALASILGAKAGLAYKGQAGMNEAAGADKSNLFSAFGSFFGK